MSDSSAPRTWTLGRIAAIAGLLVCLAILGYLGTWQFGKYLNKRGDWALMNERMELEPLEVSSAEDLANPEVDYRRARLAGGELEPSRSALVSRRFYKNQPGFWVLTPYVFDDGSTVIVQRGWIPEEGGVDLAKEADVPPGDVLIGMVHTAEPELPDRVSREKLESGTFELSNDAWPTISDLDTPLLYDALPYEGPPRPTVVMLGRPFAQQWEGSGPIATHEHITAPYLTPGTHLGYAVMWYGSGLLLIWIFWAGWTGRLDPGHRARSRD